MYCFLSGSLWQGLSDPKNNGPESLLHNLKYDFTSSNAPLSKVYVVAPCEAFYIDNKRFDLDTLRVPNRSPTPILKSNYFLRKSDDIGGFPGAGAA